VKRIAMDQKLRVNVPIELVGEPAGVKQQGGILEQLLREVEVECLPGDIPNQVELNVADLVFGMVLRVADLPKSDKLKFVTDEDQPVAHVITIKEEEAPAVDAIAGAAAATPAEPEVMKKGKQETDEGGGEAAPEKAEKKEKK
jgi:large subunit ribosomal protein L25